MFGEEGYNSSYSNRKANDINASLYNVSHKNAKLSIDHNSWPKYTVNDLSTSDNIIKSRPTHQILSTIGLIINI